LQQLALFCLFAIAFSRDASAQYSGVVLENGYVHIVNTSQAQDSNQIFFTVEGNSNRGTITLSQRGPTTFCPFGPTSCGRSVSDSTIVVDVSNKKLTLQSITNNPVTVLGQVSKYQVVGHWSGDEFRMTVSYLISLSLAGGITSQVPIKGVYAGKMEKENSTYVLKGFLFGFVVPYVSTQYGGTDPYQFLVVYGPIDSSQEFSTMAGYRAYSPLGTATLPYFPAAPNAVSGTVSNVLFDGGLVSGKISLSTPVGARVSFVDADFVSDYEFIDEDQGYFRINSGRATKDGVEWWFDNLNVVLADY